MESKWPNLSVSKWIDHADTYADQALLYVAQTLYHQQAKRLEIMQGQLDGQLWSRKQWQLNQNKY